MAATLASSEILVESVLIYVIKPTEPLPVILTPSYNPCATDIVFFNVNPNFLEASCCIVLVVNGGAGVLFLSPFLTSVTIYFEFFSSDKIVSTSLFEFISIFLPFFPYNLASKSCFDFSSFKFT